MEIRAFIPVSKEHATDSEENTKNAEVLYYCLSSEVEWVGRASGGTVTIGEEVSFYPLAITRCGTETRSISNTDTDSWNCYRD